MPRDAIEIYRETLREKLDAVVAKALPLALNGDFAAVERLIHEVNSDIDGWLAMARTYIQAIVSLGGQDAAPANRDRINALFQRAVALREMAYPMPHTKEEADSIEEGRSQDRSQVVNELGFDPRQWSSTLD